MVRPILLLNQWSCWPYPIYLWSALYLTMIRAVNWSASWLQFVILSGFCVATGHLPWHKQPPLLLLHLWFCLTFRKSTLLVNVSSWKLIKDGHHIALHVQCSIVPSATNIDLGTTDCRLFPPGLCCVLIWTPTTCGRTVCDLLWAHYLDFHLSPRCFPGLKQTLTITELILLVATVCYQERA